MVFLFFALTAILFRGAGVNVVFQGFSIFAFEIGHFVQGSGTIFAILVESHPRNTVKLF